MRNSECFPYKVLHRVHLTKSSASLHVNRLIFWRRRNMTSDHFRVENLYHERKKAFSAGRCGRCLITRGEVCAVVGPTSIWGLGLTERQMTRPRARTLNHEKIILLVKANYSCRGRFEGSRGRLKSFVTSPQSRRGRPVKGNSPYIIGFVNWKCTKRTRELSTQCEQMSLMKSKNFRLYDDLILFYIQGGVFTVVMLWESRYCF